MKRTANVICSKCRKVRVNIETETFSEAQHRRQVTAASRTAVCYDCKPEIIHNNTPWDMATIKTFPRFGGFLNSWRKRFVDVYQVPVEFNEKTPGMVVSVGSNFQNKEYWLCLEPYADYKGRIENADWREYK